MRVAVFSTKSYDKEHFNQANSQYGYEQIGRAHV